MPCRLALALVLLASPALADLTPCTTSLNGAEMPLFYDPDDSRVQENTTRREAWFGDWGTITCPGFVSLRALTPDLTDDQRGSFCLQYDRKAKTYTGYAAGERDAYAICRKPSKSFCQRVNESKDAALAITGFAANLAGAGEVARAANEVSVLTQDNGAVEVKGTAAQVASTLGRIGSTALTAMAAPAELGAAAVTVIAVGGVVYYCRD